MVMTKIEGRITPSFYAFNQRVGFMDVLNMNCVKIAKIEFVDYNISEFPDKSSVIFCATDMEQRKFWFNLNLNSIHRFVNTNDAQSPFDIIVEMNSGTPDHRHNLRVTNAFVKTFYKNMIPTQYQVVLEIDGAPIAPVTATTSYTNQPRISKRKRDNNK